MFSICKNNVVKLGITLGLSAFMFQLKAEAEVAPDSNVSVGLVQSNSKRAKFKQWATYLVTKPGVDFSVRYFFNNLPSVENAQALVKKTMCATKPNGDIIFANPLIKKLVGAAITNLLCEAGERLGLIEEVDNLSMSTFEKMLQDAIDTIAEDCGNSLPSINDLGKSAELRADIANDIIVQQLTPKFLVWLSKNPKVQEKLGADLDKSTATIFLTKYLLPQMQTADCFNTRKTYIDYEKTAQKVTAKLIGDYIAKSEYGKRYFERIEKIQNKNLRNFCNTASKVLLGIHLNDKLGWLVAKCKAKPAVS